MVAVGDPIGAGLVSSLARPEGNITGNSSVSVEVAVKSIEILKQLAPERRRLGILWNPANAVFQRQMVKEAEAAGIRLGFRVHTIAASDTREIDKAFETMMRERVDTLAVLADPVFLRERTRIASLAVKAGLPTAGGVRDYAEAGGLLAYGPNFYELYRAAAAYVDRILKGATPGELPVEQATKLELVINLKTARALGLTMTPSLLARADELLE
jgi:putative ABC transport system substrate-binding protein